jgi:hypothetical protein
MLRYRQGKWKTMRVIEMPPVLSEVRGRSVAAVEEYGKSRC